MAKTIVAALLIGGKGERFWPRSRRGKPKQFLAITSEHSMLIETWRRVRPVSKRIMAIVGGNLFEEARDQFACEGAEVELIAEPVGRSTAPALGLAAIRCDRDEVIAAFPSDHYLTDDRAFQEALGAAADLASRVSGIVCIGFAPSRPETGYGYIRPGSAVDGGPDRAFRVRSFAEKPPVERATRLIDEGALWNGGVFVVRAGVYLDLVARYIPELASVLARIRETGDDGQFRGAPSISVDYGILEKAEESYVVRVDFQWDDVGDWGAIARIEPPDADGNVSRGDFVGVGCKNVIVDTDDGVVGAVGVENIAIIRSGDAVLVVRRGDEQKVKELLSRMDERGLERYK